MLNSLAPLWISLKTALTATAIAFILGTTAANWMLSYRGKAKGLLDGIFTLPLVLPPTVVGFLLLLLLGKNGPLGKVLALMGIQPIFSWTATVIAATVVAFPLTYKTTLGAFKQIDLNLLNAARTLGACEWTVFWRLKLPLAWQGILAGTILAFARALGEFGATLMLAGNIPGKTQTIPLAIFFAAESGKMNSALNWVLAISSISLAVVATLEYLSANPQQVKGRQFWRYFTSFFKFPQWRTLSVAVRQKLQPPSLGFLSIDLCKQTPGFSLDIAFNSQDNPLGFLGASGSGKSMTLRCLAGLETPTSGRIILNGRVLFDDRLGINLPPRDRRIGFVFQNYALFPHLTVAQNVAFGLNYGQFATLPKKEKELQVAAKLALVELQGLENRYPHQLSGGQQQRVALARALAIEPEALLLDEPFSALDTHLRNRIEKQLREVLSTYQGVTLFVSHNIEEVYRVCQTILVLSQGQAIAFSSKQEIFKHPPTLTVAQLTGCKNFSRARQLSPTRVEAVDWGCSLKIISPITNNISFVGIRAHHLIFSFEEPLENTFPSWIAGTSETPHRLTLYIKLNSPPTHPQDYHLQAEVYKEKWEAIAHHPFPWNVQLAPQRLLLMTDDVRI